MQKHCIRIIYKNIVNKILILYVNLAASNNGNNTKRIYIKVAAIADYAKKAYINITTIIDAIVMAIKK